MTRIVNINSLLADERRLVESARDASAHAYAPYSGFAVGAAARSRQGRIYVGANLENAAYGLGICAEISAITAASAAGDLDLEAIAVVGHKFTGRADASQTVSPCGRCRQVIHEVHELSGSDITVYSCSGDLQAIEISKITELLPNAFGPGNLGVDRAWPGLSLQLRQRVAELAAGPAVVDAASQGPANNSRLEHS